MGLSRVWQEWGKTGDDWLIVCDICSQTYHLQCSGVQYKTSQYWSIQLDEVVFEREEC